MGKVVRWTLLFVVLVIFASGAVAFYTIFFRGSGDVVVPLLREMAVADAVAEAERLGLTVKLEQVDSSLPEGRVLAQNPEPGVRARKARLVILQVSKGGERRPVPDVRGQELSRAENAIRDQGFAVGSIIRIKDGSQPGGVVIAQSPSAPANIPQSRKIDLLVSEGGGGVDGRITVPDVARMSEREARGLLTSSGLRITTVDRVYSPSMSEGQVIGTRPEAGMSVRVGDGVRLRIATLQEPARAEAPPSAEQQDPSGQPQKPGGIVVTVPGQGDILIGVDEVPAGSSAASVPELDPNLSMLDQRPGVTGPRVIPNPAIPPAQQQAEKPAVTPPTPSPAPSTSPTPGGSGGKMAKVRYQVPPLARPLALKIEIVDPSGTRVLMDRPAKSGEYVSLDAPYSRECVVTVWLGGEFVWQDK